MRIIKVKEVYAVDRISNSNSKPWLLLQDMIDPSEEVLLDFQGIDLVSPWTNLDFRKLMTNSNVNLRLYNLPKEAKAIEVMCIIDGIKTNRVENVVPVVPVKLTKEQLKVIKMGEELQQYFEIVNGVPSLMIFKRFSQIGSYNTVDYAKEAVRLYCEKHNVKDVDIVTNNMLIQDNMIERFAKDIVNLRNKEGINLSISSTNEDVVKKLKLFIHNQVNEKYDIRGRLDIFKRELKPGTVGMLTKYKFSRAKDAFGRQGKGVPVSCRVCIYMGLVNTNGTVCAKFRTFDKNYFYTRTHWSLEHDGEIPKKLVESTVLVELMDIGLKNIFLGSQYHFMLPSQRSESESILMYSLNENGSVVRNRLTIPERAKVVFDDYDIKYNVEELDKAILDTKRYLESVNE